MRSGCDDVEMLSEADLDPFDLCGRQHTFIPIFDILISRRNSLLISGFSCQF